MANNECMLPEFNLFGNIPVQHQGEKWFYQEFTRISLINDKSPITIVANGTPNQCWALHKSYLTVTCKIIKGDGTAVAAAGEVSPCNNVLDSMFQQIDVELGDKQVSDNNNMYMYRAYMVNPLSYSEEAQKTWMRGAGYVKDTATKFAVVERAAATNLGVKDRGAIFDA